MKNLNYFNLNQIKSNPDGQTTVKRQSRLMLRQGWFRNLAMIFAVLVMSMANVGMAWGAVGTSASTTLALSSSVSTGLSKSYNFYSNASNADTLLFSLYDLYNSSATYAYSTSGIGNSSYTSTPTLYNAITGNTGTSYTAVYTNGKQSNVQKKGGKDFTIIVSNCTAVIFTSKCNGSSNSPTVSAYMITDGVEANEASATISNKSTSMTTKTLTGLTAANTYAIKFTNGTTDNTTNQYFYEVGLIYPHAGGGSGSSTTYDVTYNANSGGTGTTAAQTDNADASQVTTQANGFTPNSGKKFKWWNTKADGSGEDFYPGEKVTINGADVELFAQWETVAANEEFWVGNPTAWTSSKFSVGDMDVKTNSTSKATFITDLTSSDSKVNGSDKHAKVILVQDNNYYIQISFSDGSTINDLRLGITTTETSSKNAAVVYSTMEDFSSGEYETKTVSVPANNASAKSLTNFSPATSNKFKYVRIYRKISTAVYSFTGGSGNNLRIYAIKAQKGSSCEAPSSVGISGTYAYLPGQTLSLTATPTGHTGTPQYQWQKETSTDVWEDIDGATSATYTKSGIGYGDSGNYRCVVSTGATCSTTSPGYGVHVYSLNGGYEGESWTAHDLTIQSGTTGQATVHLAAGKVYEFKISSNCGKWYGNAWYTLNDISNWEFTDGAGHMKILTGPEGDYTFTVDVANGQASPAKVSVSVAYPSVSHPNAGYVYITKWWDHCYVHYWNNSDVAITEWNSDAEVTTYTTICGNNYYYMPALVDYHKLIIKDAAGDAGNSTENQVTDDHGGKYITHDGSWGWHDFTTYTVTTAVSTAGYGTVSAASVTGVACGTSISASTNTLSVGATNVTATHAAATAEYTYAFDNWTWTPAGATVTSNVTATANFTRTPKSYTLTWVTDGDALTGTYTSGSVAYGTTITKPDTPTKTGYNFSAWSPSVASTMPAANTTYTATWTAKTTAITINANTANHGSTAPSPITATYGSALPSFTAAAGVSGWNLTGYFTEATSGTKVINANGSLVPSTDYADASGNWKYETSTLTLYPQYEEEVDEGECIEWAGTPSSWTDGSMTISSKLTITSGESAGIASEAVWSGSGNKTVFKIDGASKYIQGHLTSDAEITSVTISAATNQAGAQEYAIVFCANSSFSSGVTVQTHTAPSASSARNDANLVHEFTAPAGTKYFRIYRKYVQNEIQYGSNQTIRVYGVEVCSGDTPEPAGDEHVYYYKDATHYVSSSYKNPEGGEASGSDNVALTTPWTIRNNTFMTGLTSVVATKATYDNKGNHMNAYIKLRKDDNAKIAFTIASGYTATIKIKMGGYSGKNESITMKLNDSGDNIAYSGTMSGAGTTEDNYAQLTYADLAAGAYTLKPTSGSLYISQIDIETEAVATDETAPTLSSSVPDNGATSVATSGNITLTFSENVTIVDASKFSLSGGTGTLNTASASASGAVVTIPYSGLANSTTYTLATAAGAVEDAAGNDNAALSSISFTTAAAAPATKDIYYGAITITAGALTKGSTGTSQFFTNIGGTIANNTEISWSSGPGTGGEYYESNVLTDTELSKSSNWNTSSGSNRYVGGMKFQSGSTYTLALGSKVASSITFYGRNGSASKTMTVGGEDWTSSATKNTFAKHEFIKTGGFTGDVSITQDGDFYGILVITIQTATPCTTPVIPTLSNQTVCPGSDIAAWDATQTAVLADGETASYSWKKKGNDTELANTATFDLGSSAAESQAGTYVVTVTVSKAGKASATATKEVTLTVTAAVEEPVITANKATVYPGNSVTLTATCGTDGVTWNWYLCANADGTGAGSSLGTSSSYTIASAGAAGTYYYKAVATGDGTHSCGAAEYVYTLTVTAASECEKYFWFVYAADAASNGVVNNRDNFFGSSPKTGSSNSSTYKFTLDGTEYTATRNTGDNTFYISFTVPEGSTATLALNCKGSSSKPIYLIPTSGDPVLITDNSSNAAHVVENIAAGTYKVGAKTDASASWTLAGMAVQVCTASSCTDATPTITAANTTICVGSELSISSTGYETGATFQWQKLNNSTSTWDNISGATSATYTVATAAAEHAGSYRLVATKGCARTSNTVTISVSSAPNFGSTVPASVSVMQTIALSINTVEATDATKYKWYKSADATWDAGDTEIGTNKELIKAYDGETIGNPSYYIFCRAQNACGITTSSAIAVNVTAYVEEDCATRGNEGDAQFGFEYSAGQATYNSTACWSMNDNSKKLIYAAPDGKYFKTMKVTIASSSASKASYRWSTDGGTSFTEVAINSINTTLTEKTIDVSVHGNVNALQIGRNLDGKGESSGTLYVSKICFEYTDACTATTVTPSATSKTYEMGGAWSNPTFTLSVAGTLTYSSSNEDIASVDDDGTVTFNGEAGTVTITAAYAGNATYCASEGSYTITVTCPGGAPKVVQSGTTVGCSSSITLQAKQSDGTSDFADGTYQWFRNGEEIDGETSSSYTATQAGTYTVSRTKDGCTSPSSNSAVVTSTATEPEVERLVPFQYYHVDKDDYSDQMKMRHLFAVKNSGKLDGKSFKMYVSRNGGAATDVTSSNALEVWPNGDGHVDTVMVNLNKLKDKYSENDELVFTCKAIDCESNVSEVYKNTITMRVIGATPTLALICSGSNKASGTRKTGELTVGGDFLTGYNVADLCQQTGGTSFDGNTEWGLYTDLKTQYIVTPVNGYAVFNKLNYEPFDILLLTDYPKASKSDAAADVLDDMAALCDYRPMLSFKTHMVAKSPSKWAEKGFTTSPVVTKADGKLNLNIVCYAHPMFEHLKDGANVYRDADNSSELVYTMLSGTGYEGSKGMQGFEIDAAENFVTIGLTHYNASAAPNTPSTGNLRWTPDTGDRMLVTVAERQANIEARFILFSINCGAQSKLTPKGEEVILACLEYLLDADPLHVADCSFTFDNGANAPYNADWYKDPAHCPGCTGELGDGKWSTQANWGPDRINLPGEFTSARIAAPVTVDMEHAKAMELRIIDEGRIDIPANKALDVKSTIRRMEGSEIYPTEENDIHIGSGASGNGTLIFNNNSGDTKARVDMYSNALADVEHMSAATSTWQYIGTPHNDIANAQSNYYDSWLYQYSGSGWEVIPNGGPLVPFRGYCVTHPDAPVVFSMEGTLAATTTQDIAIPAGYTVIANSWVAPIDINAITDDDMEGITDKTIYFFNTGTDAGGTAGTGTAAGTYRATPIHSSSYTGDWQIPSMQGFYVSTTSAGTLHLDYDRHVRPTGSRSVVSNPMYAPRRAAAESDEPNVLKIFARGSRYQDKLVVLEREDFTRGYDSGWDGEAWGGSNLSPMVYVTGEGREDAVSAIPEFEGTVIAFKAGEDNEYTIDFEYNSEEPLYLLDTENNTYTQIMTGNAYYFTTSDKSKHARFILTRKSPQITTGVGNVSGDEVQGTKAKKLLIEDKMFIMVNGVLYDATGKVVK